MDSSSIDNESKVSAFNKFKRLLYKPCPWFSKIGRVSEHLNQLCVLLHECMPSLSQLLSIDNLLKNFS